LNDVIVGLLYFVYTLLGEQSYGGQVVVT